MTLPEKNVSALAMMEALGIDARKVRKFVLTFAVDDIATATVERFIGDNELLAIQKEVYQLHVGGCTAEIVDKKKTSTSVVE